MVVTRSSTWSSTWSSPSSVGRDQSSVGRDHGRHFVVSRRHLFFGREMKKLSVLLSSVDCCECGIEEGALIAPLLHVEFEA
jgi:hypothetical protein